MATNKNFKFLFKTFNNILNNLDNFYLNMLGEPVQKVRHATISEDEQGLLNLQNRDLSYFIEELLEVSGKENFELENN